jgi:hypothetical protein
MSSILSSIKTGVSSACSSIASNAKTNAENMSTIKKIAVATSTLTLLGGSIAAFVLAPTIVAFGATLGVAATETAVYLAASGVGSLALGMPAFSFLTSPKAPKQAAIELEPAPVEKQVVVSTQVEPSVEKVAPSRFEGIRSMGASALKLASDHKYLLLTGAVLVTATVIGARLGKDGIAAKGRDLLAAGQNLPTQAANLKNNIGVKGNNLLAAGKKLPTQAADVFAQMKAKLPGFKK